MPNRTLKQAAAIATLAGAALVPSFAQACDVPATEGPKGEMVLAGVYGDDHASRSERRGQMYLKIGDWTFSHEGSNALDISSIYRHCVMSTEYDRVKIDLAKLRQDVCDGKISLVGDPHSTRPNNAQIRQFCGRPNKVEFLIG